LNPIESIFKPERLSLLRFHKPPIKLASYKHNAPGLAQINEIDVCIGSGGGAKSLAGRRLKRRFYHATNYNGELAKIIS